MLSYDAFTARVASRGGGAMGETNPIPRPAPLDRFPRHAAASTSPSLPNPPLPLIGRDARSLATLSNQRPPPPLLATLAETYDVYANLARSGLWFDVNPSWRGPCNSP
jgi:hypothetical protein